MSKNARSVIVPLAVIVVALVVALATPGRAANCKEGMVEACPLVNGCGGQRECVGARWTECQCAGVSFQPGGIACEQSCDGQLGSTACDATCTEVVGCITGSCTICEGTLGRSFCKPGDKDSSACVGPEVCNNCDDDADGLTDNAPGDPSPNSLIVSCNPYQCTVGGTAKCTNGQMGPCTGCSGTGTCTVCGSQTPFDCSSGECEGVCRRDEECNHCDDNGNGVLDDGLHCAACDL